MNQAPFEAHLGHATWLCLQDQDEIASRFLLAKNSGRGRGRGEADHLAAVLVRVPLAAHRRSRGTPRIRRQARSC
jgi:hypothetical protein